MPSVSDVPTPLVDRLTGLDYSVLTTPAYQLKSHRQKSYDIRHVDLREKRGKRWYGKLHEAYKKKSVPSNP